MCNFMAAGKAISRVRRTMSRGRARGSVRAGRIASGRTPQLPPAYHSPMTAEKQTRRDLPDASPANPPVHQGPVATPKTPLLQATSHSSEPLAQLPLDRASSVPPPPPPLDDQIPLPPSSPRSPPRPATAKLGKVHQDSLQTCSLDKDNLGPLAFPLSLQNGTAHLSQATTRLLRQGRPLVTRSIMSLPLLQRNSLAVACQCHQTLWQ